MTRIYECQTDALFLAAFARNPAFLVTIDSVPGNRGRSVNSQIRHRGSGNTETLSLFDE